MTGLTEFLLERIAEDEAEARQGEGFTCEMVGQWDADRVLAECAAKRLIVELAEEASGIDEHLDEHLEEFGVGRRDEPYLGDVMLRALAAIYSDHPDFDPAWELCPT